MTDDHVEMRREAVVCDDHIHDCPHLLEMVWGIEAERDRLQEEVISQHEIAERFQKQAMTAESRNAMALLVCDELEGHGRDHVIERIRAALRGVAVDTADDV